MRQRLGFDDRTLYRNPKIIRKKKKKGLDGNI